MLFGPNVWNIHYRKDLYVNDGKLPRRQSGGRLCRLPKPPENAQESGGGENAGGAYCACFRNAEGALPQNLRNSVEKFVALE